MPTRVPRDYIPDSFVPFRLATIFDKSKPAKRKSWVPSVDVDRPLPDVPDAEMPQRPQAG